MPAGVTEYAWPHILPCWPEAAMLTAQWQAALMSQVRPASIVSKAPSLTSAGGLLGRLDAAAVRRPAWCSPDL